MNLPKNALPNARPVHRYLESLACPYCKENIVWGQSSSLTCCGCKRTYEVVGNIPILLPFSLLKGRAWQRWKNLDERYERFYRHWSKERHLSARRVYDAFYEWCGIGESQNLSVLDIGGANGIHRLIYWNYPEMIDYFNLDPRIHVLHPYHMELYPSERELSFPYIVGVGEWLPFKPNTFDVCVTTAAVDHFSNPIDVFHEIFRCLKPGKSLYIMAMKLGALPNAETTKGLMVRMSDYYHEHGFLATAKKLGGRMGLVPRLIKPRIRDAHTQHFSSPKELTDLLYMFKVTRTKEVSEVGRTLFFVECRKEQWHLP